MFREGDRKATRRSFWSSCHPESRTETARAYFRSEWKAVNQAVRDDHLGVVLILDGVKEIGAVVPVYLPYMLLTELEHQRIYYPLLHVEEAVFRKNLSLYFDKLCKGQNIILLDHEKPTVSITSRQFRDYTLKIVDPNGKVDFAPYIRHQMYGQRHLNLPKDYRQIARDVGHIFPATEESLRKLDQDSIHEWDVAEARLLKKITPLLLAQAPLLSSKTYQLAVEKLRVNPATGEASLISQPANESAHEPG